MLETAEAMSISDLGGRPEHFAPIQRDDDASFHAPWEKRAFGMTALAAAALVGRNVDAMRASMERLPPKRYFENYWGRWLGGLELELERQGVLAAGELAAVIDGRVPSERGSVRPSPTRLLLSHLAVTFSRPLPRWMLAVVVRVMGGARRSRAAPKFRRGDAVRAIAKRPAGHTRLPGYACGKCGVVVAHHGAMAFPDTRARFEGDAPEHLYTVRFDGRDLWGSDAEPACGVWVDLFESYLEER
jgi:nitrile hydratase